MTLSRLDTLFIVSCIFSGAGAIFYGNVPPERWEELAHRAESLQNPAFNHALRASLSDGVITHYEFFNLNKMANRLEIEMKQARAESLLNNIADASH